MYPGDNLQGKTWSHSEVAETAQQQLVVRVVFDLSCRVRPIVLLFRSFVSFFRLGDSDTSGGPKLPDLPRSTPT